MLRRDNDQLGHVEESFLFSVWKVVVFGSLKCIEIRNTSSWREKAIAWLAPTNNASHFLQSALFDKIVDGRYLIREHVGVRGSSHPFASERDQVETLRYLVKESRMG